MNNANITKRPPNQLEIVKAGLSGIADSIVDALPATMAKYLTPERIIKMTALEVGRSPKLLKCTLPSILRAAVDASTLGLEIGSTIGQAYLVPFKNNKTGQMEAHLIVGYQGYIALCHRSGDLADVDAGIVREGDVCEYQRGTKAFLHHRPNMVIDPEDQDKWIFAYCVANFTNGGQSITTMTAAEIAKVRKMSRAPAGGPWDKWTDQMWLKSVIRRGRKKWPFSVDLQIAAGLENIAESGGHIGLEFDPVIRAGMKAAIASGAEIGLPAAVARDKTATLLDDLKAAEANPECQLAAEDWESQRPPQNGSQATPDDASDPGQPLSTQSDMSPPPDGHDELPPNPAQPPAATPSPPVETTAQNGPPTGTARSLDELTARAARIGIADVEIAGWLDNLDLSMNRRTHKGKRHIECLEELTKWIDNWERDWKKPASALPDEEPMASKETIGELFQAVETRYGHDNENDVLSMVQTLLGFPEGLGAIDELTENQARTVINKCRAPNGSQERLV